MELTHGNYKVDIKNSKVLVSRQNADGNWGAGKEMPDHIQSISLAPRTYALIRNRNASPNPIDGTKGNHLLLMGSACIPSGNSTTEVDVQRLSNLYYNLKFRDWFLGGVRDPGAEPNPAKYPYVIKVRDINIPAANVSSTVVDEAANPPAYPAIPMCKYGESCTVADLKNPTAEDMAKCTKLCQEHPRYNSMKERVFYHSVMKVDDHRSACRCTWLNENQCPAGIA